jgi:F-type H+-transporting ATPase subunit delta
VQTLADGGQAVAARQGIVRDLFADKVSAQAIDALCDVVAKRWSGSAALVEAIETLGAQNAFADAGSSLDTIEDQIFAFGRLVDSSAELQMALTDPSASPAAVESLVRSLLGDKVDATALSVLAYFASHLRGRRVDAVIDHLSQLAAAQNGKAVAEVRSVVELSDTQKARLATALEKLTGHKVRVNVAIDPSVVGGISVNVAGEIFDGTVSTRLDLARRALLA